VIIVRGNEATIKCGAGGGMVKIERKIASATRLGSCACFLISSLLSNRLFANTAKFLHTVW